DHARHVRRGSPTPLLTSETSSQLPCRDDGRRAAFPRPVPGSPVPRICVIGSANLDMTMALPRLPRPGETVAGGTLLVDRGGKGANQAAAARMLGAEVRMIGCVGRDGGGGQIREGLVQLGIGVEGLMTVPDAATGTALILVDPAGYNQIGVALGANDRLTVDMASAHEDSIAWADVLLCQLEVPLLVVRWAL